MTLAETIGAEPKTMDVPTDAAELRNALIAQRDYTLALYDDLPADYWTPRDFPFLATVNPPLWELAHVAWFQEFFALRWRADDVTGSRIASCLAGADELFDSALVPQEACWSLNYPTREDCLGFMRRVLDEVLEALARSDCKDRYGFQLALVHEDMHAEALAMTLVTLGLALPVNVPKRRSIALGAHPRREMECAGGEVTVGASLRSFSFDNEKQPQLVRFAPFCIDTRVVSAAEFAEFADSAPYRDDRYWTAEGIAWREAGNSRIRNISTAVQADHLAAMHMSYFEAEAYCRYKNRRLPTEAEWESAAVASNAFFASTGHVWEWTASRFLPYNGFQAERYREYSEPWFHSAHSPRTVLKGGSFLTHPRLKYPQYRNFYSPERNDVFCGFRTCAVA